MRVKIIGANCTHSPSVVCNKFALKILLKGGACMNIGYYWVKHFNNTKLKIIYFNGFRFETFASDSRINDEIESYIEVAPPDTMECANLLHTTSAL
jgi:hypothetical protein